MRNRKQCQMTGCWELLWSVLTFYLIVTTEQSIKCDVYEPVCPEHTVWPKIYYNTIFVLTLVLDDFINITLHLELSYRSRVTFMDVFFFISLQFLTILPC